MAITVDNAKLLQVAEMVQAEEEALSGPAPFVGKSDPTQWPALTFPTFPVTKIQAGVSPIAPSAFCPPLWTEPQANC